MEVLLGLLIAAIIGLAVFDLFWTSLRLDDRLRWIHDNYMEVLMADQTMTKDLENAVSLDWSINYPDAKVFDGKPREMSFLTVTAKGIRRVRYFSGIVDFGKLTKTLIGSKMGTLTSVTSTRSRVPVEFLLRQEQSIPDWLNGREPGPAQIVAAGLKEKTFHCQYAPFSKDIATQGEKAVKYTDTWDNQGLPMAVSCSFSLYNEAKPQSEIVFKRNMFLPPLWANHETE